MQTTSIASTTGGLDSWKEPSVDHYACTRSVHDPERSRFPFDLPFSSYESDDSPCFYFFCVFSDLPSFLLFYIGCQQGGNEFFRDFALRGSDESCSYIFMHKNAKMIHERALRKAGICGKKKMAFKYLNVKSYRVNRVLHYR